MGKDKARVSAKAVGAFVPNITRPVFEKFGFQRAALLTDWTTIVGEPLANFTAPEAIKWAGAQQVYSDHDQATHSQDHQSGGGRAGELLVRVEGPAALEVQHQSQQIIERINRYFGYRAITKLRILQAPLVSNPPDQPIKRVDLDQPVAGEIELQIKDDRLKSALTRLWRGIQSRKIND